MENKKDAVVLSIRTKQGENLLGFYMQDSQQKISGEPSVVLYRPISIKYVEYFVEGKLFQNYHHEFYFPFGGPMVEILHSDIRHSEIADDFFTFYYGKILGEEIVTEERLQNRIISFYEEKNVRSVMEEANSKSIFVKTKSEYMP